MTLLREIFAIITLLLFLLCAYRFFTDKNALRDDSTADSKPYSFSRVQLWWWTVLNFGHIHCRLWIYWHSVAFQ